MKFVENVNEWFSPSVYCLCPECGNEGNYIEIVDGNEPGTLIDMLGCDCGCRWNRIYKYAETEIVKEGKKND